MKKNPASAVFLFQKAANQGNEMGLLYLGMMTFHGIGIAKDPVDAYKWVVLAETYASGDASHDAILKLKAEIAATLTPEQIDMAENRAGFWSPVFPMP